MSHEISETAFSGTYITFPHPANTLALARHIHKDKCTVSLVKPIVQPKA